MGALRTSAGQRDEEGTRLSPNKVCSASSPRPSIALDLACMLIIVIVIQRGRSSLDFLPIIHTTVFTLYKLNIKHELLLQSERSVAVADNEVVMSASTEKYAAFEVDMAHRDSLTPSVPPPRRLEVWLSGDIISNIIWNFVT